MESEAAFPEQVGCPSLPDPFTDSPLTTRMLQGMEGDTGDLQHSSPQDRDAEDFQLPRKKMLPHSDSCAQQFLWIEDE